MTAEERAAVWRTLGKNNKAPLSNRIKEAKQIISIQCDTAMVDVHYLFM